MKPFCSDPHTSFSRGNLSYTISEASLKLKMSDTQTAMVIEAVTHYKRKLLRHANDEKGDVVLHCLAKLDRVPMTIEILQETGVGRVVNQLKKSTDPDSQIADEAKNIVRKWN